MRVVCAGLATRDTIWRVPEHPPPDGRVVATELVVAGGGPAATAAVTLARLGIEVAFVGAVGDDEAGAFVRNGLEQEGVDVSSLAVVPSARTPQSAILVAPDGARAIIHHPGEATLPRTEIEADWLHVDHVGYGRVLPQRQDTSGSARSAEREPAPAAPADHEAAVGSGPVLPQRWDTSVQASGAVGSGRVLPQRWDTSVRVSVDGGNPIPSLDLAGVALYAPTEERLRADFGDAQVALDAGAELVVVTRGAGGSVATTRDGDVVEAPGVPCDGLVSTLGAGDVFHGALLASLIRGLALPDALRAANTAASLSCRALDGRSAIPTRDELERSLS
jgi:sulfofructose kinase